MKSSAFVPRSALARVLAALFFALVATRAPSFAATVLPAPDNASALFIGNRMQLTWAPVTGATRYVIRQRGAQGYTIISSVPSNVFFDDKWKPGDKIDYLVQAVNDKTGDVSPPKIVAIAPSPPLTAPTGFKAVAGDGEIALTWDAQPGATAYNVWRSAENQPQIVIGTSKTTRYIDRDVINGIAYHYALHSRNAVGFGGNYAGADAEPKMSDLSSSVSLSSRVLAGGEKATLTVSLDRPASGKGVFVRLSANNTSAIELPSAVFIAPNSRQVAIPITTRPVTDLTIITISVVCNGFWQSTTFTINPPPTK